MTPQSLASQPPTQSISPDSRKFPMPFYGQHIKAGRLHLQKNDRVMKRILKTVGPFLAKTKRDRLGALVQSIVSQQISRTAAQSIHQRLVEATATGGSSPRMQADRLLQMDVDSLCQLGLSQPKATAVLDLAANVQTGALILDQLHRKDNEAVIDELTHINGIGLWTAQMFLMFALGRLDIFPAQDVGIKNAIHSQYSLTQKPDTETMEAIAAPWHPYATIASWYLWQTLELQSPD